MPPSPALSLCLKVRLLPAAEEVDEEAELAEQRPAEAKFLRLQRCRANSLVAPPLRPDNRLVTARAAVEVREVPVPLQRISPLIAAFSWI
jgi:hypothetical protein